MEKKINDSIITIEGSNAPLPMSEGSNYALGNNPYAKKKVRKKLNKEIVKEKSGNNIGIGSSGFAGVITLASIIAIVSALAVFFLLKY